MTKLTFGDKKFNQAVIEELFFIAELPADYNKSELQALLLTFAENNDINYRDLIANEEEQLVGIIRKAAKVDLAIPANQEPIQASLIAWKDKLVHAVYGKNSEIHIKQSAGMADNLLKSGSFKANDWGTDIDIRDCLRGLHLPDRLQILPPVSITEYKEAVQDALEKGMQSIKDRRGDVGVVNNLHVLVNCGRAHWRLLKVAVKVLFIWRSRPSVSVK